MTIGLTSAKSTVSSARSIIPLGRLSLSELQNALKIILRCFWGIGILILLCMRMLSLTIQIKVLIFLGATHTEEAQSMFTTLESTSQLLEKSKESRQNGLSTALRSKPGFALKEPPLDLFLEKQDSGLSAPHLPSEQRCHPPKSGKIPETDRTSHAVPPILEVSHPRL